MSQTHAVTLPTRSRSRLHLLAPLLLLTVALALITVALVQDGGDQVADTSPAAPSGTIRYGDFNPLTGRPHSAPLPRDSRPPLSTARPDESKVAAAIGAGVTPELARPDESGVAAAIGSRYSSWSEVARPDEGKVAAAVGGGYQSAQDSRPPAGPTPFGGQR
jgi:hypothetical protein